LVEFPFICRYFAYREGNDRSAIEDPDRFSAILLWKSEGADAEGCGHAFFTLFRALRLFCSGSTGAGQKVAE
jgi:hypothetical protein